MAAATPQKPGLTGSGAGQCPRCDYDLTGTTSAWDKHGCCDLAGTCPECGLNFEWGQILDPRQRLPPWSIEHRPFGLGTLTRSIWRGLSLWRLWTRWDGLRLEHPVVKRRLLLLALLMMMVVYAVGSVIAGRHAYLEATAQAAFWATVPAAARGGAAATPGVEPWETAARVALMPWTRPVVAGAGTWTGWWSDLKIRLQIPMVMAWCVLVPAGFACLPDSLSRAAVRWRHLLRAWAYSTTGVACWVVAYLGTRQAVSGMGLSGTAVDWWTREPWPLIPVMAWLLAFWFLAISRYLRLEQPRAVTAAMMVVSGLAAFTLGVVVGGRDAVWPFYF